MTVTKKIFAAGLACALLAANIYAQDDWGSDDWSGDSAAASENSGSSFWERFKISGDANLAARWYFDGENASTSAVNAIPSLKLGLDYDGDSTKFSSKIRLDEQTLKYENEMILDEFKADLFVGDFVLSAGKMKVVWGKGDKLHVLDNFNSNNYYDFLMPDYLDRRNAEYMFRAQYNSPLGFRVEGIYTPIMHAETYAQKGPWVPNKVTSLTNQVLSFLDTQYPAGSLKPSSIKKLSTAAEDLYPDTYKLEYGQFGGYVNFSIGPVDLGVSYYNGHYKQVSANLTGLIAAGAIAKVAGTPYATAYNTALGPYVSMPSLHYDKLQSFGLDAQTAIGPFTLRSELVYNLTKDTDGNDPWTHNNSIGYLFGFDVGLPVHNLNLNVQMTGNVILKKNDIKDNKIVFASGIPGISTEAYDADYDPTGKYTNHKIVVQLQDKFYYEKITATIKAIYGIERADLILMPEVSFKVRDGWKATASGLFIHNFDKKENSEFYGWLDNSFIQLAVNYTF
ncbi:MAG: hypothetical protein IK015_10380 [Treponema sp.]|nr:hypothetical protein [Treponema sp.]